MEQEASVRADIQKFEETLAKEPGSYCFAPLAELYRKLGLLDEAVNVAKRGCELHPEYVGGYMALGRACVEKGLHVEGRDALERVVTISPDNLLAQKLLSRIYAEQGNCTAAADMLQSILSQNPDDSESRSLLDSLDTAVMSHERKGEAGGEPAASDMAEISGEEDEIVLEDADIIEELGDDDLLEDDFIVSLPNAGSPLNAPSSLTECKSPLSTITMAELYVSQGFEKRALTIYRELLEADPDNAALKKRLYELKAAIDEDTASARYGLMAGTETVKGAAEISDDAVVEKVLPAPILAQDVVVETLEKWLDTIKRRR